MVPSNYISVLTVENVRLALKNAREPVIGFEPFAAAH
jgi:hypothetical protein